jgi:hypothetical protein
MGAILMRGLVFFLFFTSVFFSSARALDLYVSIDGNDDWSGRVAEPSPRTADGPFRTLDRAKREIREIRKATPHKGPLVVNIRAGMYYMERPLVLEAEDSGENSENPVTWRGYNDEQPILTGGKRVTGFEPWKGQILKADLHKENIAVVSPKILLCDESQQVLARYPNADPNRPYEGGWAYVDGRVVPPYTEIPGETKRGFHYRPEDAEAWNHVDIDAELFVFPRYNWWNNIIKVAAVDREEHSVTLASDCSFAIRPGDRYFVQNIKAELDAPGEWLFEKATGILYFWPKSGADLDSVFISTVRTLMVFQPGASNIKVRGITFECSEGTAINIKEAKNCEIRACIVRNVGDYSGQGIVVDGGANNGIIGCNISYIGSAGISLSGGDVKTLSPGNNFAENNYIHHTGRYYKQGVGISIQGLGQRAAHNLIHDCPRSAFIFHGNNHLIEFNRAHRLNQETYDTGAVHTGGRDWLGSRGTIVRYNFFYDIGGFGVEDGKWVRPSYAWGIYLDDNTGGVTVFGNIVVGAVRGLVHLHNGRDNIVENNIFVDGGLQQMEFSGWTDSFDSWKEYLPSMIKGYESVRSAPAWASMPHMDLHPRDAVLPDHTIMSGNVIVGNIFYWKDPHSRYVSYRNFSLSHNKVDRNLIWHGGSPILTGVQNDDGDEWKAWQKKGMDQESVVADPLFVAPEAGDYRLKPESPAFKLGFKPIPSEKIGPYKSEDRASWPIVEAPTVR